MPRIIPKTHLQCLPTPIFLRITPDNRLIIPPTKCRHIFESIVLMFIQHVFQHHVNMGLQNHCIVSSACAVVITRGLDRVRLESSSIDYLTRITSGNYRHLPYAIELWIEHCSQYASGRGSLDRPFRYHLARMHEKHKDCLHELGPATIQVGTQGRNNASHVDERLELYSNMPIYGLVADVLSLRRLASQLDGDNSSGRFRLNMPLQYG
jgi:hypothetical protein